MTDMQRAMAVAERVLMPHYRGPQNPQGFIGIEAELRSAIVEAVLELLRDVRRYPLTPRGAQSGFYAGDTGE